MALKFGGKSKGKGAPVGNKNAAGPHSKGGARSAAVGSLFGPLGVTASGMYVGATKDKTGRKRHKRTATAIGGASGTLGGALTGATAGASYAGVPGAAVGGAIGGVAGGLGGAGAYYIGASVGQAVGKNMLRRKK